MRLIKKLKLKVMYNGKLYTVVSASYKTNEIFIYEKNVICGYIDFDSHEIIIQ